MSIPKTRVTLMMIHDVDGNDNNNDDTTNDSTSILLLLDPRVMESLYLTVCTHYFQRPHHNSTLPLYTNGKPTYLPLVPLPCPHNLHYSFSFPFFHTVASCVFVIPPVSLFSTFTAVHYRCFPHLLMLYLFLVYYFSTSPDLFSQLRKKLSTVQS